MKHRRSIIATRTTTRIATSHSRSSLARRSSAFLGLTAGLVFAAGGCAKVSQTGGGASGGITGLGAQPGTGSGGSGGLSGLDAASPPDQVAEKFTVDMKACTDVSYMFTPMIPTVTLLVDRSGSMFHCLTGNTGDAVCADMANTSWSNLKMAIESVITQLDSQVRFGFSTVWGTNPMGGGMCPSLQGKTTDAVAPALNNAATITTLYDGLVFPPNSTQMGMKFESPASESIAVAAKALEADTTPGSKYIIFLTDGQPDYCDDSNSLCAPDSVVYQLQTAATAGIKTIVFGVQTSLFDLAPGVLQAFANAGAGEPTIAPVKTGGSATDFYDQCNSITGWMSDLTASGKPNARGTTLGTYATTMGPTMPYQPSASNLSQLVTQLSAAISGVKSCTFDLGNINGMSIKVNRDLLNEAQITIMGNTIPLDDTNGWRMNTDTQLELTGSACDTWRDPATDTIDFKFPCDIFIVG
ncbi:MAG TPA: hypothetical protein VGP07_05645 [Polyangia bacterium]